MVADDGAEPIGPGVPQGVRGTELRPAAEGRAEQPGDPRCRSLDVRFFATAVLIQRETGGNLSEILDNLAYVVRERFKILRQVRVYTAHGRMTGYVLLALPAFARDRADVHQPRAHEPAVHASAWAADADGHRRHADDRLLVDSEDRDDRGLAMSMLLPLLAFVFASLIIARARHAAWPPARGTAIDRRLAEVDRVATSARSVARGSSSLKDAVRRSARRCRSRRAEMGKVRLRLIQAGYPRRRGAAAISRHPDGGRARRVRAVCDAAAVPAQRGRRPRRIAARLHAARHRAGAHGEEAPAQDAARPRRRPRPDGRQRRGRPRPRPGDHARRRRARRSPIPTCRTSSGWSTSSCAPARRAPKRCATWPIAPASTMWRR